MDKYKFNKPNRNKAADGLVPDSAEETFQPEVAGSFSNQQELLVLVPTIDQLSLNAFFTLPKKIQKDIKYDIIERKKAGISEEDILKRAHDLIKLGIYLSLDTTEHLPSDTRQGINIPDEELKLMEEIGILASAPKEPLAKFLERMEQTPKTPKKFH